MSLEAFAPCFRDYSAAMSNLVQVPSPSKYFCRSKSLAIRPYETSGRLLTTYTPAELPLTTQDLL